MPENNLHGQVWVSELNARPEIRGAFARSQPVRFYDTTLRDGEQTVGVVLSPQQKLEIARKLDELGVSRIEAGFPRVSADDAEAIRLMSHANLKAELWGFSRAVKGDLEELVRLGVRATIIEAPTSDIKLKAYGISRDEVLRRVREAISFAKQSGITVAFFAVDGTRTRLGFLKEVYLAALEAGAAELVVVDTIGACGPEAAEFLTREVCAWAGPDVPVHWHGHNDFGLGTASAVAAVRGGATWVQGTINGMGERAGNADICEIALALVAKPRWRRAGRRKSGSRENCCASQHANPRTDWAWGNWSNGLGRAACGNGEKPGPADPVAGARPVQLPRFGRLASWTD